MADPGCRGAWPERGPVRPRHGRTRPDHGPGARPDAPGRTRSGEPPIETVGLRPGEKLHEELFYDAEQAEPTASAKVLRAIAPPSSLDVREHVRQLLAMASGADEDNLRLALLTYVGGIERPAASPTAYPEAARLSLAGGSGRPDGATGRQAASI